MRSTGPFRHSFSSRLRFILIPDHARMKVQSFRDPRIVRCTRDASDCFSPNRTFVCLRFCFAAFVCGRPRFGWCRFFRKEDPAGFG